MVYFININGTVTTVTEEGGTFHTYKSSAIPNREFTVSDSGNTFWTTYTGTPADGTSDGTVALDTVNVSASDTITLSGSEIAAIINAQNRSAPQADDYVPAETAPVSDPSVAEPPQTETATLPIEPSLHGQLPPAIVPEPPVPTDAAATNARPTPPAQADNRQQANGANQTENGASQTENTPTDPLNQSIGAIGDAAAYADAALSNPHQAFLAEAEKFKNSASLKHDLASGFSQTIIEFEEGRIYDERRAYYANNREALNEAVEKIRTDTVELTQKHGEAAGKAYFLGSIAKITGTLGTLIDAYELGDRAKKAFNDGNWDPVAGQVAKIAASAAAVSGSAAIARGLGVIAMMAGAPAWAAGAITIVGGALITFAVLEGVEALEKEISNANRFNFSNAENTDLVLFGNHSHSGDTKLAAKSVTLIGNHRFENLEIESEEITVIGNIDSDGKFILNADSVNVSDGKEISEDFARQVSENREEAASEVEPAADTPTEALAEASAETPAPVTEPAEPRKFGVFEEAEINWDYVDAVTAQRQITADEYYQSLIVLPEIDEVVDQKMLNMLRQNQDAEWEKILARPSEPEERLPALPEENPTYPDMPQPAIQTKAQENQII